MIVKNSRILFQGDSITDAGRDRDRWEPNDAAALGNGYAYLAMTRLLADQPLLGLEVFNRGISGNRVPDLAERWARDCLELEPDVLSILIGINDLWHKMEGRYAGSVLDYETAYRDLLRATRQALPHTQIVICEPFVLRCGAVNDAWFPEFEERRAVASRLAKEFRTPFVAFHALFERALASGCAAEYWAEDGVHPTPAGHQLMADAWLAAVAPRKPA
jgi:lysophospholipase L1-like esterase